MLMCCKLVHQLFPQYNATVPPPFMTQAYVAFIQVEFIQKEQNTRLEIYFTSFRYIQYSTV